MCDEVICGQILGGFLCIALNLTLYYVNVLVVQYDPEFTIEN